MDGRQSSSDRRAVEQNSIEFYIFSVSIHSNYWDQAGLLAGKYELVSDKTITFNQVIIPLERWYDFLYKIKLWKESGELFSIELSEHLTCELVVNEQGPSNEKPVFNFSLKDTRHHVTCRMTIDPTSFSERQA